jgi:pyruvate dehydrogenase (quinone)
MSKNVAEHLVDLMLAAEIRHVYGMVGDSANPVIDAIRRAADELTFVPVRNEEAGAFAAGAEALITGRPTAVIGSSGPGSLHLLNSLYDCDRSGAPVFAIVTHVPSPEIGTHYFQETRPEHIFADCTRYIGYITSPSQMPRLAALALEAAILERGVGMVIVPGDVGVMEVEGPTDNRPLAKSRPKIRPLDVDLDTLAERIEASSRPMIFGGEGCRDARDEVLQLASLLHAPVGYSYRAKDVLEAGNPNAVGMTGLLGWGGAHQGLAECDLLLLLGTDFPYRDFLPTHATIVQIDDSPGHLGRRANVDLGLVGDVGDTLRCLLPRLTQRLDRAFLDATLERHVEAVDRIQAYVNHEGSGQGLRPEMVATAISDLAADDAVFTNDTGMCNVWGARYLRMKPDQRLLASFRHGSMANALPQAIGVTIGAPDRQVIALCGDGGFSMLMGEMLSLGGLGLPVKVMLFNNSTLGMVRIEMAVAGYIPFGTDVKNPDFGAIARAAGIHGERVESTEDVRPAIARAFAHDGPALIDFVTDPRALSMPPRTTIAQVRGMALAMTRLVFAGDTAEVVETIKSNVRNIPQAT